MIINKEKLRKHFWYENCNGQEVDKNDPCACSYVNMHPLTLIKTKYRYSIDDNGKEQYSELFRTNITYNSGEECIVAMVNSGDYTLSEAIILYATACERCANVLQHKYLNGAEGYPEFSEEWKKANTECEYCEDLSGMEVE